MQIRDILRSLCRVSQIKGIGMSSATQESIGMNAARLERIAPAMQSYVDRGIYAGVSTIVARRGVVVHSGYYGLSDKEAGKPMTEDTIFRLYSMTKPIVCTALMMLLEEARFRLLDPVAGYLPAFAGFKVLEPGGALVDPKRPMTVRDLITHMSGLSYHFLSDSPVSDMYADAKLLNAGVSLGQAIDDLARYPLAFQPGSRWHYSIGIDVAARLIEVISGQALADLLRQRLFVPLGMVDTDFEVPVDRRERLAAMYGRPDLLKPQTKILKSFELWREGFNERIDVSATYPVDALASFQRGGHGLFSTARDYLRFAQMLANGGELDGVRYLSRKTLALMHSNHLPRVLLPLELAGLPIPGCGFGLGSRVVLDVAETGAPGSIGDFGWAGAAKTYYWVDPVEQIVGIFMTQSMTSFDLPELDLRALAYGAIVD
jgi:CubicO group peptidase (beta-lactamase class C family)